MLHSLKFGFAADPKAAGFTDGVLPYEMPSYDESELEPWFQYGVPGGKRAEPRIEVNRAVRNRE